MASVSDPSIDILMITYNRPEYTRLSLGRLLATCDATMRVWLWHNGTDRATLDVVQSFAHALPVCRFYHSIENQGLRAPTNWLWQNASGAFVSKVDDDCLLPDGWAHQLRQALLDVPQLGVIGCWRFQDEDFIPGLALKKIRTFEHGHQLLQNCWVEGSGYLLRRELVAKFGPLREGQSFTHYCIELALAGLVNGWYYPFIRQEHMDDPRAPHSLLKTDADFRRNMPLSARTFGVDSLATWTRAIRRDAREVQEASVNPRRYVGWRGRVRRYLRQWKHARD
ncbi:MAG: glycosyltransferase family A protein [Planctomycetota bacterium]